MSPRAKALGLDPETYADAYRMGRAASRRMAPDGLDACPYTPRDPRSDAWEDGYLDHATDRDIWHLRDCLAHGNGPGECGQA